jgi:hypothetical protein
MTFEGYKEAVISENGVAMAFEFFPGGGELFVQSSMGYATRNTSINPVASMSSTATPANNMTPGESVIPRLRS